MLLTGTYRRSIDDKLRIAMPKMLRESLAKTDIFIAPGNDSALVIYTAEILQEIGRYLSNVSPAAKDARAFNRLFYSQAQPAEIDKQGRLRVPAELASLASLNGEVVIVGVRDRLELWNSKAWEDFLAGNQPSYDELSEQVFETALQNQQSNPRD
ncbi:MAG: division/cell wall cluster transcriptional repressor MraZ [Planctomycetota bacterium]